MVEKALSLRGAFLIAIYCRKLTNKPCRKLFPFAEVSRQKGVVRWKHTKIFIFINLMFIKGYF